MTRADIEKLMVGGGELSPEQQARSRPIARS
jgi:hypothetical protein